MFRLPLVLLLLTLIGCFLAGCGTKEVAEPTAKDSIVVVDSFPKDTDSIPEAIIEIPPSKADELFDDFLYNFMRNRKFQQARVDFPLPHIVDSTHTTIDRKDWKHQSLYVKDELFMTLHSSKKTLGLSHDPKVGEVVIQELDIPQQRITSYNFQRVEGEWRLTSLETGSVDEEAGADTDFMKFYCRFAASPEFQRAHLAGTIQAKYFDDDELVQRNGTMSAAEAEEHLPILPTDRIVNVNYGQKNDAGNTRILSINSSAGDMSTQLTFRKQAKDWMLTAFEY